MKGTVLLSVNAAWNAVNFRMGLIHALQDAGWDVVVAAGADRYVSVLEGLGISFEPIPISPRGVNPISDIKLLFAYLDIFRRHRPKAYLGFTVKPNVYGSIAAWWCGVRTLNNIAGLGLVFSGAGLLVWLVTRLYKFALRKSAVVYFQNDEDLLLFLKAGIIRQGQAQRLPGSGVDLGKFEFTELNDSPTEPFKFLLVGRLLWEKGVGEYVEAAKRIRSKYPGRVEFYLLGFLGNGSDGAVTESDVAQWEKDESVHYLGVSDEVAQRLAVCDCVVLPSYYREGVPRALLEAAAVGRPIVTTDWVGCRETVVDGETGFLCRPRDVDDLTEKMETMLMLDFDQRAKMGRLARKHVENFFDQNIILQCYVSDLEKVVT
ncbi:glycosyltransferase family 4 protein [Aquabacterium sp. NJ1]|uniref:glycosyltransferase family 4 protein n=1 Tax=Aquabacterium sp. NJ1 TaxID=1538295 RepID=UPI001378D416|nr:glycosyltransferase family 4 protein [Aquabacterium sp. NJ1]